MRATWGGENKKCLTSIIVREGEAHILGGPLEINAWFFVQSFEFSNPLEVFLLCLLGSNTEAFPTFQFVFCY